MKEATLKQRRSNTRSLRGLIEKRTIVIDDESGQIYWPNGKRIGTVENSCGYLRFKIQHKKCRYYFVHKAVYLHSKKKYRHNLQIDHIDNDVRNNRIDNLRQITPRENTQKAKDRLKAYDNPPAF